MSKKITLNLYAALLYRLGIMMVIFTICRLLFFVFNSNFFPNITPSSFGLILLGGLKFDISAVLYLNLFYILLTIIPHPWQFRKGYQNVKKWFFYVFNSVGIILNCTDFIYYRFILKRTTAGVFKLFQSEENMGMLWVQFLTDYWYAALIAIFLIAMVVWAYNQVEEKALPIANTWLYYASSALIMACLVGLSVAGLRGGFRYSTRPINMSNAGKYVEYPNEMAIVLNTPFCVIRTFNKKPFSKKEFFDEGKLQSIYSPIARPINTSEMDKKNVVIFILESFGKEYIGGLNQPTTIPNYRGYTPFLDSLIQESLVFPNGFANGKKSIDAMPAVIASIPSHTLPYVSSESSGNKINSLANLLHSVGYETAFFHGGPNGSMGFESFASIAGFDRYVGKTEFNNDDFNDGLWGIWDEPFFQFFATEMNTYQQPFFTTLFSLSSHHPFKVPEQYEGVFPVGDIPMHQVIGYTDMALRKFFETAQKMPWYDNTLFVITADHTNLPFYEPYTSTINSFSVPLVFYTPDGSLKGKSSKLAQQADILPTVLGHLNYPKPFLSFGSNLLDDQAQNFVVNYRDERYQIMIDSMVLTMDENTPLGLYNWKNDTFLKNNTLDVEKDTSIINFAKAYLQQYNNRMIENRLTVE